ncbi:universal stress protein [Polaribacter aquimarinus]|uniref:Universal stress protein n=1 Tax=Polaribacter aquimarinus TaxID=2100726 RepID=A0A2U2JCC6_9FLAO|nr:universal stress protein [Polaribacter aquimarinus]PWG05987.1 universal stress protein [Polaribacter aquimarinus]
MNKKYRILVLSDVNNSIDNIIQSALNLAKVIKADIEFLCVKKPSEMIGKESQLSAIRTINREFITTSNKVKELLLEAKKGSNINVDYKVSIGNLKDEISQHIKTVNPDIIVLGKNKPKFLKFTGDKVINFILKEFKGMVMIASEKKMFEVNDSLKPGVLNSLSAFRKNHIIGNLLDNIKNPLTRFRILDQNENFVKEDNDVAYKEYVFDESDNVVKNISKYLSKSNINLLFIDRKQESLKKSKTSLQNIINTFDCSLILSPN